MIRSEAPGISEAIIGAALTAWAEADHVSELPVQGTSMCPLLRPGDRVSVSHRTAGYRIGELLVYRTGSRLVIHRLRRADAAGTLLMGGDCLPPSLDALVPRCSVLGRVVAVRTPTGGFSLISQRARLLNWLLAVAHPLRGHSWSRRLAAALRALVTWALRR